MAGDISVQQRKKDLRWGNPSDVSCMDTVVNVIKTIASMTKKKAHLLYTKQIGGLFHVFMDISQFAFMFPMSLNVTVMNVYLSVLSDNLRIGFINWNLRL